jgi:hypothetical protein
MTCEMPLLSLERSRAGEDGGDHMRLYGLGAVLALALLGSAPAMAETPEGERPAAVDQQRAERAKALAERRAAAEAERGAGAAARPTLSPEERERLVRERRARAERAGLGGTRAVRPLAGVTGERGRVPAVSPNALKLRLEQRQRGLENGHNRRLAQFRRIRELAEQSGDTGAVERVDALIAKENEMHAALASQLQSRTQSLRTAPARPTVGAPRTVRPVPAGVRPGAARPTVARPVAARPVAPRPAAERPAAERPTVEKQEPETGGTP